MDWTDKKLENDVGDKCAYNSSNRSECVKHWCTRHFWSCGDGQCIMWRSRVAFQVLLSQSGYCHNLRNLNYMCEVSTKLRLWTMPNGKCTQTIGYDNLHQDMHHRDLSDDDKCIYLIRCAYRRA